MSKVEKQQVPKIRFEGYQNQWKEDSLITIADYVDYRGKTPTKTEKGVLLVTAKNIRQGYIDYSISQEYIAESDYDNVMSRGKVRINDVLITTEAPLGNVALVDRDNIALAQRVIKYRGKEGILNNLFLKSCLHSDTFQNALSSKATGGTVQGIKGSTLHKQYISYSSDIKEQTQIGNFFQQLDKLIDLQTRAVESAETYKKAMLQKMFPQKGEKVPRVRFEGFSGDWEKSTLNEMARVFIGMVTTMTAHYVEIGVPLIRNSDIKANSINQSNLINLNPVFVEENSSRKLQKGDIVTVHTGDVGVSAVIPEELEGCVGFATLNTRIISNKKLESFYLACFFNTRRFLNWCLSVSTGDGRTNLNLKDFEKAEIVFPVIEEQRKISNFFQKLDQNIESEKKKLEQYQTMKRAMLQRMFV